MAPKKQSPSVIPGRGGARRGAGGDVFVINQVWIINTGASVNTLSTTQSHDAKPASEKGVTWTGVWKKLWGFLTSLRKLWGSIGLGS